MDADQIDNTVNRKTVIFLIVFFASLMCMLSLAVSGLSDIAVYGNITIVIALAAFATLYSRDSVTRWMRYGIGILVSGYLLVLVFISNSDYGMIASFIVLPSFAFLCYPFVPAAIWGVVFFFALVTALYVPGVIPDDMIEPSLRHAFVGAYLLQTGISGIAKYISTYYRARLRKAAQRIDDLEKILSMCANCRKVKLNEQWVVVEKYLRAKDGVEVSHGICPGCYETQLQSLKGMNLRGANTTPGTS